MITIIIIGFLLFAGLAFALTIPVLFFKKPTTCPKCGHKFKAVTKRLKCINCRTKLYRHTDGEYKVM